MSDLPRVKIVNPGDGWLGTECYINDQKIERVRAVDFRVAVDEVPTFTFETVGTPDIDMPGDIRFSFTPKTVTDAIKVLLSELLKHSGWYNAFLACIESAVEEKSEPLMDCDIFIDSNEWAEHILKRIIGEE